MPAPQDGLLSFRRAAEQPNRSARRSDSAAPLPYCSVTSIPLMVRTLPTDISAGSLGVGSPPQNFRADGNQLMPFHQRKNAVIQSASSVISAVHAQKARTDKYFQALVSPFRCSAGPCIDYTRFRQETIPGGTGHGDAKKPRRFPPGFFASLEAGLSYFRIPASLK